MRRVNCVDEARGSLHLMIMMKMLMLLMMTMIMIMIMTSGIALSSSVWSGCSYWDETG